MKPADIVAIIKKSDPQLLGVMPEARAAALTREILRVVGNTVNGLDEGKVSVAGLGTFVVKNQVSGKAEPKSQVRRVIFRSSAVKKI